MARFTIDGMDEIIAQMKEMHELTGSVADAMLIKGAEESKRVWVSIAKSYPLKQSGKMIESIGYAKGVKSTGDAKYIEVYPRGSYEGKSNAMKGFMVNYRDGKGAGWVNTVHEYEEDYIVNGMTDVWNEFLATGVVPNVSYPQVSRTAENGTRIALNEKEWPTVKKKTKKAKGHNPYYYPQYKWEKW